MRIFVLVMIAASLGLTGCSSTGTLGIITKSTADPGQLLKTETQFQELGPVEGKACRHFVLAVAPWGKSDVTAAVDKALETTGGDALINVSVESSLYGFVPIYNIYSFTCTTVQGIAVKIQS